MPGLKGEALQGPARGTRCLLLCQQALRVATWLPGRGWWPPVSSTMTPGCRTGKALAGPGGERETSHLYGGLGPDPLPGGRRVPSGPEAMGLVTAEASGEMATR